MYLLKFTFPFIPEMECYATHNGQVTPNWDKAELYSALTSSLYRLKYYLRFIKLPKHMRPKIERITI